MENNLQHKGKQYNIVYCNNTIISSRSIDVVINAEPYEFHAYSPIIIYYNGRYYYSDNFEIKNPYYFIRTHSRIEIKIKDLVDITRDHNINIILDE